MKGPFPKDTLRHEHPHLCALEPCKAHRFSPMHAVSAFYGVIVGESPCGGMNSITVLMTDMDGRFAMGHVVMVRYH